MKITFSWQSYLFAFIGYFILGRSSLYFATMSATVSPVWPATGFSIFCMLAWGFRVGPSIYLAAALVDFTAGTPWLTSGVMALGNVLEPMAAVLVMGRFTNLKNLEASHARNLSLLVGSSIGALNAAAVGIGALYLFGIIKAEAVLDSYLTWWTGDVIGAIFFTPIFLNLFYLKSRKDLLTKQTYVKLIGMILLVLAASALLYFTKVGHYLIFIQFYLVLISFLMLPSCLAYLVSTLVYVLSIYANMRQLGPFHNGNTNEGLMHIQLFFAGVAFTIACLEVFALNKRKLGPFVVLAAGWVVASGIYLGFVKGEERSELVRFAAMSNELTGDIEESLGLYESFLRAGKGFVLGHSGVDRQSWKTFVDELQIEHKFDGINGIGFLERVQFKDLKAWELKKRKVESADFQVHDVPGYPTTNQDERIIISYVEPRGRNKAAWGLILSTEKNRRMGLYKSIETKKATLSSVIQLVQDEMKRPGFLYYLPVYKNEKFLGWVYAPFIASNVFKVNLERYKGQIDYGVFIENSDHEKNVLIGGNDLLQKFDGKESLEFADTQVHIYFKKGPLFRSQQNVTAAWVSMVTSLIALLFAVIVGNFQTLADDASRIADEKTKALHESEALLLNSAKFKALGEMAGGIAHEINNPLSIIRGLAGQMERTIRTSQVLDQQYLEKLGKILKTVDRISSIINGLRSFSRSEETDSKSLVSINSTVELTLSFCEERFQNSGVKFSKELLCQDSVLANGTQLSQVILNLLNNSFDAIESLEDRWIQIKTETIGGFAQVSVTDSGSGIPADVAAKMMQPFFTTKPVGQGTGLGLSISKGIIEAHKGTLEIDRHCANTRFVLRVPIARV